MNCTCNSHFKLCISPCMNSPNIPSMEIILYSQQCNEPHHKNVKTHSNYLYIIPTTFLPQIVFLYIMIIISKFNSHLQLNDSHLYSQLVSFIKCILQQLCMTQLASLHLPDQSSRLKLVLFTLAYFWAYIIGKSIKHNAIIICRDQSISLLFFLSGNSFSDLLSSRFCSKLNYL